MPYKKKRTYRRRPYKRTYRKKYPKRTSFSLMKSPAPKRFATKLRYSERIVMDAPAGGLTATQVYSANGLYDPNITGVGHQPRGFDQFMAMYDHFVVVGSKISAIFMTDALDTTVEHVGVALRDSNTTALDPNDYLEGGTVRSGMINVHAPKKHLSLNCSVKRFLGRSKPLSDPQLKGSAAANPTEQAFFHLFVAGADAENPTRTPIQVTIDYLVVFVEPKVPAQS